MHTLRLRLPLLAVLLLAFTFSGRAQTTTHTAATALSGTSWQLVKFQSGNDTTLTPDDPTKYTIAFDKESGVSLRIDCNRGHSSWKSAGPNQLEFGPMALTRAMCPPSPITDRLPIDWENIRSYTIKGGHLFLSLNGRLRHLRVHPRPSGSPSSTETLLRQLINIHSAVVVRHVDLPAVNHRRIEFVVRNCTPHCCESHNTFSDPSAARCTGSYTSRRPFTTCEFASP